MKSHIVWWPRLDRAPLFNPFIPTTEHRTISDRVEFPEAADWPEAESPAEAPVQSEDRNET